jgi:hypothetical protein
MLAVNQQNIGHTHFQQTICVHTPPNITGSNIDGTEYCIRHVCWRFRHWAHYTRRKWHTVVNLQTGGGHMRVNKRETCAKSKTHFHIPTIDMSVRWLVVAAVSGSKCLSPYNVNWDIVACGHSHTMNMQTMCVNRAHNFCLVSCFVLDQWFGLSRL